MAPNKFENDFKQKLDKRAIAPSKGAWDKLSDRLDAEENSSNYKGFWWLGIAASIVGVLLVVSHFFSNDAETNSLKIVDTEETVENPKAQSTSQEVNIIKPVSAIAIETTKEEVVNEKGDYNLATDKTKLNGNNEPMQIVSAQSTQKIRDEKDLTQSKSVEITSFETEKAQEVADAIYALSEMESGVSNTSIDSLLKAAQKDILLSRMKNEDKVLVDAALLLQEVEFELDQSFRDKVFKALKDSYGSVKTAIAQRND